MSSKLLETSRDQIIQLLRRARRSVNDLASALGLTDNAVRANLARLQRDGLVQEVGQRPALRKPESIYDITPKAERLFPKAYAAVLAALLAVMERGLDEEQLEAQLREVGRDLAGPHRAALSGLDQRQRAEKTLQIMEELGGLAELEQCEGKCFIRGFGCPFGQLVVEHPKLCIVAQELVGQLLGRDVQEQCDRGDRSRCCFVLKQEQTPTGTS
jgi:predicted ArsR family transcriptional regulator